MSLTDLTSLASLVSSVAVLVSLLFIGLQIRQSNRNQRSLMQQGRSARNVELLSRLSDPRPSDVMLRVARGEPLTDTIALSCTSTWRRFSGATKTASFSFIRACSTPRVGPPTLPP